MITVVIDISVSELSEFCSDFCGSVWSGVALQSEKCLV